MSSPFYEPYRDWDPFIAWNELKEREDSERLLRAPDEEKEMDKRKEAKEN